MDISFLKIYIKFKSPGLKMETTVWRDEEIQAGIV